MSLSRALFNEFRPFFRLLEDPFAVSPSISALSRQQGHALADPFGGFSWQNRPALNLSEGEDGGYVIEAEVPGVKKENLDVKIGDGGRSLTIEGKVVRDVSTPVSTPAADTSTASNDVANTSQAVTETEAADKQVASSNQSRWSGTRSFTRTVWLPHPINSADVKAKLEDGVLTIRAGRADQKTVNVNVD